MAYIPCFCAGDQVCSVPTEVAAAGRARWLAELSDALLEAQQLLFRLDLSGSSRSTAADLYQMIEAARLEVRSLRASRSFNPRDEKRPEWINFPPQQTDPWSQKRS
jgi:hypothetical protein